MFWRSASTNIDTMFDRCAARIENAGLESINSELFGNAAEKRAVQS
jgi:hypothetical protein